MQYHKGCFDPLPKQKKIYVSAIKQLLELLQQEAKQHAPELKASLERLKAGAKQTVQPQVVSFAELMDGLRKEASTVARETASDLKADVAGTIEEVADFFRNQGFEVKVHKMEKPVAATEEDWLAQVERMLSEIAHLDDLPEPSDQELQVEQLLAQLEQLAGVDVGDEKDSMTRDEMWEVIQDQDELLEAYAQQIVRLQTQLATQAKLQEGANARCTGLHEGILSALELIDQLDIIRAKEHLAFTLRQAGVSDCNVAS